MEDRRLICTVGLPRSGKSTWSRLVGFPICSPDAIRYSLYGQVFIREAEDMVWTIAKYMVKSLFIAGHKTVVLDATNLTPGMRNQWISSEWKTEWKIFNTDVDTCITRAIAGERHDLIDVIKRFNERYYPIDVCELETTGSSIYKD